MYTTPTRENLEAELEVETRKPTIQEQIQWCKESIACARVWEQHYKDTGRPDLAKIETELIEGRLIRLDQLELALAWDITPLPEGEMPIIDPRTTEQIDLDAWQAETEATRATDHPI